MALAELLNFEYWAKAKSLFVGGPQLKSWGYWKNRTTEIALNSSKIQV